MKVSFIGAGRMGTAMATIFAKAGHETFLSYSRDPKQLAESAQKAGARYGSGSEAVAFGDVIVLSVGWADAMEVLQLIGDFQGKTLWSIVTALKPDYSGLEVGTTTSGSEELAKYAKNARFVAGWPLFADLLTHGGSPFGDESAVTFYCGDDAHAKAKVAELLGLLGSTPVDSGPLTTARLVEPAMLLLVNLAYRQKMGTVAFKLLRQ